MNIQSKKSFLKSFQWLIIIALLVISIALFIFATIKNDKQINNSLRANTNSPLSAENELISQKRKQIETAYPEFENFENQASFAGQEVNFLIEDNDYYFAYKVSGSGLPIIKATCFRVDRMLRVYKTGEFPDPLDSYAGYQDINPKNCVGIK